MSYGINHQVPVKAPPEDVYVVLTETGKLTLWWTCDRAEERKVNLIRIQPGRPLQNTAQEGSFRRFEF